jgi:hypothetical protein
MSSRSLDKEKTDAFEKGDARDEMAWPSSGSERSKANELELEPCGQAE